MAWWQERNPAAVAVAGGAGGEGAPAAAFVCQNMTCRAPTSDPAKLRQLLAEPSRARY